MKKLLALLLCLVMCFAISACASGGDKDKNSASDKQDASSVTSESGNTGVTDGDAAELIIGKWHGEFSAADFGTKDEIGLGNLLEDLKLEMNMEFKQDGTAEVEIPEESINSYVDAFVKAYKENIIPLTEASLEGTGMTLEQYFDQLGMTQEEYIAEIEKQMNAETMKQQLTGETCMTGTYKLEGGKIFLIPDEPVEGEEEEPEGIAFTVTADTLTLTQEGVSIVLNRVK